MTLKHAICIALLTLTGCMGLPFDPITIHPQSNIQGMDYNDLANQYMHRPTYVEYSQNYQQLYVHYEGYVPPKGDQFGLLTRGLRVDADKYKNALPLLETFLRWDKEAVAQRLTVTKVIGKANLVGTSDYTFELFNVAQGKNLLLISWETMMGVKVHGPIFDAESAAALRAMLEDLPAVISKASARADDAALLN